MSDSHHDTLRRVTRFAVLALAAAGAGCGDDSGPSAGRETHWLLACDEDAQCGEGGSCVCGLCSSVCEGDEGCPAGLACQSAGSQLYDQSCAATSPSTAGLCAPTCDGSGDCASGQQCGDGACIPESLLTGSADAGSEPSAGPWLQSCQSDDDCGPATCLCGLCTLACPDPITAIREQRDPCEGSPQGYRCVVAELSPVSTQLCTQAEAINLCLPEACELDSDCDEGLCIEGHCGERDVAEPLSGSQGSIRYWADLNVLMFDDASVWFPSCRTAPNPSPGAATLEGCLPDGPGGVAAWSPQTGGTAFFYDSSRLPPVPDLMHHTTRVARAVFAASVSDIADAFTLAYGADVTEPLSEGEIAVFHDTQTDVFLALRLDRIWLADSTGAQLSMGYADLSWYLQADGSGDFSTLVDASAP